MQGGSSAGKYPRSGHSGKKGDTMLPFRSVEQDPGDRQTAGCDAPGMFWNLCITVRYGRTGDGTYPDGVQVSAVGLYDVGGGSSGSQQ